MSLVDVRGCGSAWAVLVDGKQVGRTHGSSWNAEVAAMQVQRELNSRVRPCLRCKGSFTSGGAGNRLCPSCLRFAAEAMV